MRSWTALAHKSGCPAPTPPLSPRRRQQYKYSRSLPAKSECVRVYSSRREVVMRAAYYERNGLARDVLRVGEVETPQPARGEVRVRLRTSGVNPSDVKSRMGLTRRIAFPRVIPHSDGAGEIDCVGEGVAPARLGESVW